jgi:hypothetical protein
VRDSGLWSRLGRTGTGLVAFLLRSDEPAIRLLARRELVDEEGREDGSAILSGPWVSALLAGQRRRLELRSEGERPPVLVS